MLTQDRRPDLDAYDVAFQLALDGPQTRFAIEDMKARISGGAQTEHAKTRWAKRTIAKMRKLGIPLRMKQLGYQSRRHQHWVYWVPLVWIAEEAYR